MKRSGQTPKNFSKEEISDIKDWAHNHIGAILRHYGIKYTDRGRYYTACCPVPCHPGDADNPRAFAWAFDNKSWHCYSHQCQQDTSSDIIGLVMALEEVAFPIAIIKLHELRNGALRDAPSSRTPVNSRTTENIRLDKDKLNLLKEDNYFSSRGISSDILSKHQVGYWQKTGTFMDRRAIVPVFDASNNLVGYTGRLIIEDTEQAKWVHGKDFVTRKAGTFNKTSLLYNLNNCQEAIKSSRTVYIVEGPIDVWKLQMASIYNVVATLGLGLSFQQQELLVTLGVENIVFCYDNDVAGQGAIDRAKEQFATLFKVSRKLPPPGKDFGDLQVHEIVEILLK